MDQLEMQAGRMTEARSTSGDEIRNEDVTASGNPALLTPMTSGIDEQEQKGVIVPKRAASVSAQRPYR